MAAPPMGSRSGPIGPIAFCSEPRNVVLPPAKNRSLVGSGSPNPRAETDTDAGRKHESGANHLVGESLPPLPLQREVMKVLAEIPDIRPFGSEP